MRELKPDNPRKIREGLKQAKEYAEALGREVLDANDNPTPFKIIIDVYK